MKFSTRTLIVLVILSLTTAGPAMAQFSTGPVNWTISGNTGTGGVVIKGLADDPVSDENGYYSVEVPTPGAALLSRQRKGTSSSRPASPTQMSRQIKRIRTTRPNPDPQTRQTQIRTGASNVLDRGAADEALLRVWK